MSSEIQMAALPVRQRGTLQIIDTAMKLYRRYFGVLMAWSALVSALLFIGSVVPFGAFLAYPFVAGSCACCIAAAVRGQGMKFGQVWEFTKPRYGALLLLSLLSSLLMGVALGAGFVVVALLTLLGAWALSSLGAPDTVSLWLGGIGAIVALLIGGVVSAVIYAWVGLVPIVACLEDNNRGSQALGRAFELMKGSWNRVLGLSILLGIAVLAATGIIGGAILVFAGGLDILSPAGFDESALTGLIFTFAGFFGLFGLFWNPVQNLILGVLYLDLRVRKEALDLEWNSYSTAPPVEANAAQTAPPDAAPPNAAQVAQSLAGAPLSDQTAPATLSPTSLSAAGQTAPVGVAPAPVGADVAGEMPKRPPAPAMADVVVVEPVNLTKPPSSAPSSSFDFSAPSFSAGNDADAPSQQNAAPSAPDAENAGS